MLWKKTTNLLILHYYRTPQFQNLPSSFMFIIPLNFEILLSQLLPSYPTILKFKSSTWNFIGLVSNRTFFLEKCRNSVEIIITIVCNVIVLVSHNVIFSGYFMPMNHGANDAGTHIGLPVEVQRISYVHWVQVLQKILLLFKPLFIFMHYFVLKFRKYFLESLICSLRLCQIREILTNFF